MFGGKNFPLFFNVLLAGLRIRLTWNGLTVEKTPKLNYVCRGNPWTWGSKDSPGQGCIGHPQLRRGGKEGRQFTGIWKSKCLVDKCFLDHLETMGHREEFQPTATFHLVYHCSYYQVVILGDSSLSTELLHLKSKFFFMHWGIGRESQVSF